MDWQHRLAPLPGHAYLHELLSIDIDGEEIRSRWSGTPAAAAEMEITLDEPVDPVALVVAHDVLGRFVELQMRSTPAFITELAALDATLTSCYCRVHPCEREVLAAAAAHAASIA